MDANEQWVDEEARKKDTRLLSAKVRELETENARLSRLLGLVEKYSASCQEPPSWLKARKRNSTGRATAVLQLSDLHLDETVEPRELEGLNAYSREIALLRLKRWAQHACDLGDRFKHDWEGCLLSCNGDLVSGAIHEELRETNAASLPETLVFWAPHLASAYRTVADYYKRVHSPVTVGNHGRLTEKKQYKRRGRASWDWLLMQMVRQHLANDDRFTWDFAAGSFLIVPIYDRYLFQTHGDEAGGGNGWSSVWTPLMTISRKGSQLAASFKKTIDYTLIGHWHSLTMAPQKGIVCNGSLKGYDEFAAGLRLSPEAAMQSWMVHSPEYGVTAAAPVFCVDKKAEGW